MEVEKKIIITYYSDGQIEADLDGASWSGKEIVQADASIRKAYKLWRREALRRAKKDQEEVINNG